jgi:putative pyruvate formate lyase activating enzyme
MNRDLISLDALPFWGHPDFAGRMRWYREVAAGRLPAKYRILAALPAGVPLDAPEEALWRALEAGTGNFLELKEEIRNGNTLLPAARPRPSLLELVAALGRRMLEHCNFCRWDCRVDRARGEKLGACKLGAETRVSTWFHHQGEELVWRGTEGSGTIFFTSCNMRCAFCQNGDISTDRLNGEPVSPAQLALIARTLRAEGCHNINWVGGDPTIHLHTILDAIARLPEDCNAPMLWNSNFFMSSEAMKLLRLAMDAWLPDFKFGPGRCAIDLARTSRYWETVTANLARLEEWGEDFTIRHLVMPGHLECCTVPVLDWIAGHMPAAPVNVMDQYHPDNYCDPGNPGFMERYRPLARRLRREELLAALRHAAKRGVRYEALSLE